MSRMIEHSALPDEVHAPLAADFAGASCIDRDLPSRKAGNAVRLIAAVAARGYLATYHRLQIVGRQNLPASGPFVIVSNHASHIDALCLRAALPLRRLSDAFTAVAEDYFLANPLRRTSARVFANAVPFSRQVRVRGGMRRVRSLLDDDNATLIFFPEGTRTRNGSVGAFRPGVGALLAGSSLPVVPCAIQGAFEAWPKGTRWAWPRPIRVVIGQSRHYGALPRSRQSHRLVADDLHTAVEELLCT